MPNPDIKKSITNAQEKILKQVYSATDTIVAEMDRRFTAAISADVWDWPRGESPRDIVDSGTLRASQQYTRQADGSYRFVWGVPYAAQVHEGGTFLDGSEMPARPWTRYALKKMREEKVVERLMDKELKELRGD